MWLAINKSFGKLLFQVEKAVFSFLGDVGWFGWKHPFWISINFHPYKLKGEHYLYLRDLIKPGDILLSRTDCYVSTAMIPGNMSHGAVYIGGPEEQVVHAVSEGVVQESIINFMRTDCMIVLRPPANMVKDGIKRAKGIVGQEYDFAFDFRDSNKFSCTEVVDYCYPNLVEPKLRFGRKTVVADDIAACPALTVIWDSAKEPISGRVLLTSRRRK